MTIVRNNNARRIHFRVSWWCNFKCSYCIQDPSRNVEKPETTEFCVAHAKQLARKLEWLQEIKPVPFEEIELIGGEISTFELDKICEPLISGRPMGFHLISNLTGYKNIVKFSHWCKEKGVKYLHILASLHEEFMKPDVFFERLDYIRDNMSDITTIAPTFVVHDDNIDVARYYVERVKDTYPAYRLSVKREWTADARRGTARPPYVTQKTYDFVKEVHMPVNYYWGFLVDGEKKRREDITNGTAGRLNSVGMICKDRDRCVRYDYRKGFRFGCGTTKDDFRDIVCPQPCSLCSAITITSDDTNNEEVS